MTERERFLRSICADPADDVRRLAFADWLEERDEPARAEFIRLQIRLASPRPTEVICERTLDLLSHAGGDKLFVPRCRCKACSLARREERLRARHGCDWDKEFYRVVVAHETRRDRDDVLRPAARCFYDRGFVSRVELPCDLFTRDGFAADLFRAHPITRVRLVGQEPDDNIATEADPPGADVWKVWHRCDPGDEVLMREFPSLVPAALFDRLPEEGHRSDGFTGNEWVGADAAGCHAALSLACVAYGRHAAGLDPLPAKEAV